ncbi:MAG: hypothetical protein HYT87_09515 [Nitrospirae bacterium]|nr:hypothetical protein [Nitrospirota bacterium]
MRKSLPVLTLLVSLAAPPAARSNPIEHFGFGSRNSALGLAGIAAANDSSAVFYNPAGLLLSPGNGYNLGYTFTQPVIEFQKGDEEYRRLRSNIIQGYHFGFTTVYGGWFRRRAALGLGIYIPTTTLLRAIVRGEQEPNFYVYSNTEGIYIGLSGAARPTKWLLVGAGIQALASLKGPVFLNLPPIKVNISSLSDISQSLEIRGEIKADLDVEIDPKIAPIAGVMVYPFDWLRAGAVYRGALWVPIELALRLKLQAEITGLGSLQISELEQALSDLPLAVRTNVQYHPEQFGGGLMLLPLRELVLTGDLTYKRWSKLKSNYASLGDASSGDSVGLNDLVQSLTAIFGGNVDLTIPHLPELNLKDTVNFSGGIEWMVISWLRLRGGYNLRPSPAPAQTGKTNFLWPHEHLLTGGLGVTFKDPFAALKRIAVDGHAQTMIMQPLDATKDAQIVPVENPGYPSFKTRGGFLGVGLTLTGVF